GTSSPELAVSLRAAFAQQADIALGNVVGSNIFNVLFILGLSALFAPLVVSSQLVRFDVPVMIGVSILAWVVGGDGVIGRVDGALLALGLVAYVAWLIRQSRRESQAVQQEFAAEFAPAKRETLWAVAVQIGLIALGLVLLGFGARWLVDGASTLARSFGLSELLIGLTIVAAGTSLPEVATSVMASIKGERDIAVGNVVGSNIFNILCVLGVTAAVAPGGVAVTPAATAFDIPFMIAVSAACLPIFITGGRIDRWEGLLLLALYVGYTTYLGLAAGGSGWASLLGLTLLSFVAVLTAVTLMALAAARMRKGSPAKRSPPAV
ncbi:MAG: calcium/sodium antiporter, partial [Planctomycetales bacterium]|nr:calcium/sodium antiporter [Planctomycetales bacterium]